MQDVAFAVIMDRLFHQRVQDGHVGEGRGHHGTHLDDTGILFACQGLQGMQHGNLLRHVVRQGGGAGRKPFRHVLGHVVGVACAFTFQFTLPHSLHQGLTDLAHQSVSQFQASRLSTLCVILKHGDGLTRLAR